MNYKKVSKTIKPLLTDIYKLRTLIERVYSDFVSDVDNPMRGDKIRIKTNQAIDICNNRINEFEFLKQEASK